MKKHLTTILSFATMTLVAITTSFTLTSCGEEVDIQGGKSSGYTIFSMEPESGTRTTMDADRWFYWTVGDKIWVDNGTSYIKSVSSDITGKQPRARFKLEGDYIGAQYNVIYTGYQGTVGKDTMNTSSTTVTIANQQKQSEWNNGNHLAVSGDCGKARAYKQPNGTYHFSLEHQAAYLVFYPFLNSSLSNNNYTLQRIEIYSDAGGSVIAGTYPFNFANGLADTPNVGTEKQAITLTCGDNFNLRMDVPDLTAATTYNHCFVVIAPGVHTLTINYIVKNAANETFTFIQDIDATQYLPNTVYPFIYELSNGNSEFMIAEEYNEVNTYFRWGQLTEYYGTTDYNPSTVEVTDGFWSTIPNSVEMAKYRNLGEVFYDNAVKWKYNLRNGSQEIRRGGWWLKKKDYIPNFNSSTTSRTPKNCSIGRPDDAVRNNQYFFIPALSVMSSQATTFWARSPYGEGSTIAYSMVFTPSQVYEAVFSKGANAFISGTRPDGTPWFQ